MSCGCYGGDAEYNNLCNADTPYPQISSESVPSLINNLTLALYGSYTKSVDQATGRIVWDVPCTPTTSPIGGLAPLDGEGMLCYVARALNTLFPTGDAFVTLTGTQTLFNKTLESPSIIGQLNLSGGSLNADTLVASSSVSCEGIYSVRDGVSGYYWHLSGGDNLVRIKRGLDPAGISGIALNISGDVGLGSSDRTYSSAIKARAHVSNPNMIGGSPLVSGSAYDPNCLLRLEGGSTVVDCGVYGNVGNKATWVQPRLSTNYATNYNLVLCPNGGNVGIKNNDPQVALHVTGSIIATSAIECNSLQSGVIVSNGAIQSNGGVAIYGNLSGADVNGDPADLIVSTAVNFSGNKTYGSPQIAKCWLNAGIAGTSVTTNASNGMSINRTGVGVYSVSMSPGMPSGSYAALINIGRSANAATGWLITSKSTSSFTLTIYSAGVAADITGELNIVVYAN